jgi:hypothetical protein
MTNSSSRIGTRRGLVAGFVALAVLWGAHDAGQGDKFEGRTVEHTVLTPGPARCDVRSCGSLYTSPTLPLFNQV